MKEEVFAQNILSGKNVTKKMIHYSQGSQCTVNIPHTVIPHIRQTTYEC